MKHRLTKNLWPYPLLEFFSTSATGNGTSFVSPTAESDAAATLLVLVSVTSNVVVLVWPTVIVVGNAAAASGIVLFISSKYNVFVVDGLVNVTVTV